MKVDKEVLRYWTRCGVASYQTGELVLDSIEYHRKEMEIALDKTDDRRILPDILASDRALLDIGCGIGQSFLAMDCADKICIGIDVDEDAIRYGIDNYGHKLQFILADAKHIPLPSDTFDLVFSRVSLPYTNIPRVVQEIRRVLRTGGRVWMILHGRDMAARYLKEALQSGGVKRLVHVIYILMNGYLLKYFGVLLPYLNGRYESWQDTSAMTKLLRRSGFEVNVRNIGRHTVIEGRLT